MFATVSNELSLVSGYPAAVSGIGGQEATNNNSRKKDQLVHMLQINIFCSE
jgi:hypothetical protein